MPRAPCVSWRSSLALAVALLGTSPGCKPNTSTEELTPPGDAASSPRENAVPEVQVGNTPTEELTAPGDAAPSPRESAVPEVQVGNQTVLGSRKHPFAYYIAQMHQKIHKAWAWGFLERLDTQERSHPLNDHDLWTRVEIVLDRDGRIDKMMTVRLSGNTAFDQAAQQSVHAAGPYPIPPEEIRSGNGKVYMHWAFHRDQRACGTFGAQPFIIDNAGHRDRRGQGI